MENDKLQMMPLNQKFIDHINNKNNLKLLEEKINYKTGYIPSPVPPLKVSKDGLEKVYASEELPSKYDLRELGRVSPVKDQGNLGSCWAFATCSELESKLLPDDVEDFSENNMINCHGFDYGPNDGGNDNMASAYLTRWGGPMAEKDDPYIGVVNTSPTNIKPIKHVQQVMFIPQRESYTDNSVIKNMVMQYGAVGISILYDDGKYKKETSAYYYNGKTDSTNHAVTIVGWDDSYGKNNFYIMPPANGAFIVKNSWGTSWGDNGYFYLSYYDKTITPGYVYTDIEAVDNYSKIYQYDKFGFISALYNQGENNIYMSNMFTAEEDLNLSAVSFYTIDSPIDCEIDVYSGCADTPNSGEIVATKAFSSTIYGYQTIELDNVVEIKSGEKFSVVVKLVGQQNTSPYVAIEVGIDGYSSGMTINKGESFISIDENSWNDMHDMSDLFSDGEVAGHVCLKAFTTSQSAPQLKPTIYFEPSSLDIELKDNSQDNEEFTVEIAIRDLPENQTILGLYDKVKFDADVLEVVSSQVIENCLLNPVIGEPIIDMDNTAGTVELNLARSDTSYPGANGIIYNIIFKTKQNIDTTTTITHDTVKLRDDNNLDIDINVEQETINISKISQGIVGDFNEDGNIDFEDLMLFAKAWNHMSGDVGWDCVQSDLDGTPYKTKDIGPSVGTPPDLTIGIDGKIDIEDYNIFVAMWKWKNS